MLQHGDIVAVLANLTDMSPETVAEGVVEEEELVGDVKQPAVYTVDTRDGTDTVWVSVPQDTAGSLHHRWHETDGF